MPSAPVSAAAPSPAIRLTARQEAFCQAMACNTGGAEASRRAGYSPNGAKQRGAFLMSQPEIRIRVDQLRAARRAEHQAMLDEAAEQVGGIIADALESKRSSLALRAIEFRLKLQGVIQDKRIAHHYHLDCNHPDADLEDLEPAPEPEPEPEPQPAPALAPEIVTLDDDPVRALPRPPIATAVTDSPSQRPGASVLENIGKVADGVGFEPTVSLHPRRFSRPLP